MHLPRVLTRPTVVAWSVQYGTLRERPPLIWEDNGARVRLDIGPRWVKWWYDVLSLTDNLTRHRWCAEIAWQLDHLEWERCSQHEALFESEAQVEEFKLALDWPGRDEHSHA